MNKVWIVWMVTEDESEHSEWELMGVFSSPAKANIFALKHGYSHVSEEEVKK